MDSDKLFSYALLLYFDLEERVKSIDEAKSKMSLDIKDPYPMKFIKIFKDQGWPHIKDVFDNPALLIEFVKQYIESFEDFFIYDRIYFTMKSFISSTLLPEVSLSNELFESLCVESIESLKQGFLYHSISGSYMKFVGTYKELTSIPEIVKIKISDKLIDIDIKAPQILLGIKKIFKDRLEDDLLAYEQIVNHLPLDILESSPSQISSKEAQIFFKKKLAVRLDNILQNQGLGYNQKYKLIGYCLNIGGLTMSYEDFVTQELPKRDSKFEFISAYKDEYMSDYIEFLRSKARYALGV